MKRWNERQNGKIDARKEKRRRFVSDGDGRQEPDMDQTH